eukprot:NODE_149_length_1336_cov_170.449132_g145_i0.p1 GENE.NODE_149_length_1336_cov_170.449132_g145_i0~~NODE_149_length_1336_cov_170.449132_g145_i0.p1  ORF type:complete len:386 (-),score=108.98 NODE_149_length_1336_cov_170.449132_g145_i0:118-1275(-)
MLRVLVVFAFVAVAAAGNVQSEVIDFYKSDAFNDIFKIHNMSWAVGAACLDGSPPVYYMQAGTGSGANKWYIHHEGGGWCESMEDCYRRSFTNLGSSKNYKPTMKLGGQSYFSTDPKYNPMMYNWNKIFIPYCDGGSFSGNNNTVTEYKGKKLYFRGHVNLNAVISWLVGNSPIESATDVVISGCSAGGLATYLHTDRWREILPSTTKVAGLPDSGFFLDYEDTGNGETTIPGNYHDGLVWVFNQMNASTGVDADCINHWAPLGKAWKCMFAQHTAPFITTPMFALQSQYDAWQTGHEIKSQPPTVAQINAYGKMFKQIFESQFLAQKRNGAILDCCHHHCGHWDSVHTSGYTQATAFQKWYESEPGTSPRFIQNKPYPCSACCN